MPRHPFCARVRICLCIPLIIHSLSRLKKTGTEFALMHYDSSSEDPAAGVDRRTFFNQRTNEILRKKTLMRTEQSVLFAEPSGTLMTELKPFLSEKGVSAIGANTQKETLLMLQNQSVHVMVLDADLLEEDCEFISIIKGMEQDLPIIVCAETNTPEFEIKVRQKRIFYYHIKSFGIQDLEMAISNAILRASR